MVRLHYSHKYASHQHRLKAEFFHLLLTVHIFYQCSSLFLSFNLLIAFYLFPAYNYIDLSCFMSIYRVFDRRNHLCIK